MKRRKLICPSGLCLAPLASHAHPTCKVYRIGVLSPFAGADIVWLQPRSPFVSAFLGGLRELG